MFSALNQQRNDIKMLPSYFFAHSECDSEKQKEPDGTTRESLAQV